MVAMVGRRGPAPPCRLLERQNWPDRNVPDQQVGVRGAAARKLERQASADRGKRRADDRRDGVDGSRRQLGGRCRMQLVPSQQQTEVERQKEADDQGGERPCCARAAVAAGEQS